MKKQLKPGDHVHVYGYESNGTFLDKVKAIIVDLDSSHDCVAIKLTENEASRVGITVGYVHKRQCSLIKPPKPRRTVWAVFNEHGSLLNATRYRPKTCEHDDPSWCDDKCFDAEYVEFREVRKK